MNFRRRIITTFLLFVISISLAFGLLLNGLMNFVEDEIVRDFLLENMEYFEERVQLESSNDSLIQTTKVKAYLTHFGDIPEKLRLLNDGFHETENSHILIKTLRTGFHTGGKLILSFDESQSFLDKNEKNITLAITVFSLLIILLAGAICIYLAKSIASPIEHLSKQVREDQKSIIDSDILSRKDELGSLARAFSLSLKKINNLLEREKNFTRYASHELRTPLTVVRNNVDIIKLIIKKFITEQEKLSVKVPKHYDDAIQRLDQAIWFMGQQINTLLLMARGEYQPTYSQVAFLPLLNDIEAYFPDLLLKKEISQDLFVWADPTILLTILTNLFNNAVEHGADNNGKTTITIKADSSGFAICNIVKSFNTSHDGERFGLEIVEQLCRVMNWEFAYKESQKKEKRQFLITVIYIKASL